MNLPDGVTISDKPEGAYKSRVVFRVPGSRRCDDCGKPVSANKKRCFACWKAATEKEGVEMIA